MPVFYGFDVYFFVAGGTGFEGWKHSESIEYVRLIGKEEELVLFFFGWSVEVSEEVHRFVIEGVYRVLRARGYSVYFGGSCHNIDGGEGGGGFEKIFFDLFPEFDTFTLGDRPGGALRFVDDDTDMIEWRQTAIERRGQFFCAARGRPYFSNSRYEKNHTPVSFIERVVFEYECFGGEVPRFHGGSTL